MNTLVKRSAIALALVAPLAATSTSALAGVTAPEASSTADTSTPTPTSTPVESATTAPETEALTGGVATPDLVAGWEIREYTEQQLSWYDCLEIAGSVALRCADVKVPRDWDNPGAGKDITVVISRVAGTENNERLLLSNPGGPGSPGIGLSVGAFMFSDLVSSHQLVDFDPRGTGLSTNISCEGATAFDGDSQDMSRSARDAKARASRTTANACTNSSGDLLPYISTYQTVHDMDLIRDLLDFDSFDYLGYSGGTWLGGHYANMFPEHTGRFVLDSVADFTEPFQDTFEEQPRAFQVRRDMDLADWIADHDDFYNLGNRRWRVEYFMESQRRQLAKKPVRVRAGEQRFVTVDTNVWDAVISSSLYSKYGFPKAAALLQTVAAAQNNTGGFDLQPGSELSAIDLALGEALVEAEQSVQSPSLQATGDSDDASLATFFAITCGDTRWDQGQRAADNAAWRVGRYAPWKGYGFNESPCFYWSGREKSQLPRIDTRNFPEVMLVQSNHDPATSVSLARNVARNVPDAHLLTVWNEGDHAVSFNDNTCVEGKVEKFLIEGRNIRKYDSCNGIGDQYTDEMLRAGAGEVDPLDGFAEDFASLVDHKGPLARATDIHDEVVDQLRK